MKRTYHLIEGTGVFVSQRLDAIAKEHEVQVHGLASATCEGKVIVNLLISVEKE